MRLRENGAQLCRAYKRPRPTRISKLGVLDLVVMKCSTLHCRNERAKGRTICHKCKAQRYRENNPYQAAYQNLRGNAKRRGKVFEITFEQFKEFCYKTDYIKKRGISKTGLHIDRIDETGPYSIENIQALENSDNVKKYLDYNYETKYGRFSPKTDSDYGDVPF